ncbi:FIG00659711: hypothetical protein [Alloactinosynnema sp. L-07]|uniref:PrgI family protein n=1 Tax=Alloactinosynnema sp. L-07 TaxID=1653480 RepID=UPI00065EF1BA|nr:PrgI family protein [Alloactinosynnema sp. L-07]CRK57607.1 FIG00659711: hypothetical protein [Alloactinosynnema sp. L-07]
MTVRIPADIDVEDRVLGALTARQLAILATTGLLLYTAWTLTRVLVPIPVFLAIAVPVAATAAILALGKRDGVSLDRLFLAAIGQRLAPRHRVTAPEGVRPAPDWLTAACTTGGNDTPPRRARRGGRAPGREQISPSALRLPAQAITPTRGDIGVVDLGADGLAVVAVASTVNFALRTAAEQEGLVAGFGRYLHSLTAPVQILIRAQRLDLTGQINELRQRAGGLPHPALEAAAAEHADYLTQLAAQTDLLRRQVLLVLREGPQPAGSVDGLGGPGPLAALTSLAHGRGRRRTAAAATGAASAAARRGAESRLVRRLGEAVELLGPAGIVVTPLDAGQATAVLASACNPDTLLPPSADLASADDVITTAGSDPTDDLDDDVDGGETGRALRYADHRTDDTGEDENWDDEDNHDFEDYEDGDGEFDDIDQGRRRF